MIISKSGSLVLHNWMSQHVISNKYSISEAVVSFTEDNYNKCKNPVVKIFFITEKDNLVVNINGMVKRNLKPQFATSSKTPVSSILEHTANGGEKHKTVNNKDYIFNFDKFSVVAKKATTVNGKK